MRTVLAFFLTFFIASINGQITFQRTYGTINQDVGEAVTSTFDGGYILTGSYNNGNIGVIKTDCFGNTTWLKIYDFSNATATSIIQASDSNYVIAGSINDSFLVFKINSTGDTMWTTTKGTGPYPLVAQDIAEDNTGNLIVVVSMEVLQGDNCCWPIIYKLGQNGNIVWSEYYECSTNTGCRFQDIFIDNEGNYLVSGDAPYPNVPIARLTKTDTAGNEIWTKYYSDIYASTVSITQAPDSGYVITGTNWSNDSVPVLKTDKEGVLENFRTYLNDNRQWNGKSIDATADGYYISGYTSQWTWDIFLLKIDFGLDLLWTKIYGGISGDICSKMESTADGGCIIIGWTNSYGAGNADYYLVKTDENGIAVSQPELESAKNHFIIYPNPFITSTKLTLSQYMDNLSYSIYNILGQEVERIEGISGKEILIQRKNLNCGIYLITLEKDSRIIYSEKLKIVDM